MNTICWTGTFHQCGSLQVRISRAIQSLKAAIEAEGFAVERLRNCQSRREEAVRRMQELCDQEDDASEPSESAS
jgi:hypothetical protein